MENLFRLMLVRPAVAQDPENPSIDLTQDSAYEKEVRKVVAGGGDVRGGLEKASTAYVNGAEFIGEPADNPFAAPLLALADALNGLERSSNVAPKDLADAIKAAFGHGADKVVKDQAFTTTLTRLRDSILAIKVLQEEHSRPIEELTRQLRDMDVVERVAADASFTTELSALRRWRRRSLRLPVELGLSSKLSTRELQDTVRKKQQAEVDARRKEVEKLVDLHTQLRAAVDELSSLPSSHLRVSAQTKSAAALPPASMRLTKALTDEGAYEGAVRDLHVQLLKRVTDEQGDGHGGVETVTAAVAEAAVTPPPVAALAESLLRVAPGVLAGRTKFAPVSLSDIGFVMAPSATAALSKQTQALLKQRGIDLSSIPLDKATNLLQTEVAATAEQLEQLAGHPVKQSFMRVGDALVSIRTPLVVDWGVIGTGGPLPLPLIPLDGRIPHTKGEAAPAGVADLILVKQQLTGYEAADVAHIENVLKGERKLREHTRREETEVVTLRETEVTTTEEHELETTNRFEMTRETSATIKEDVSLKAGLQISGSYGPTVEFAASAEGAYSRSKEEATKAATTFSQDVTERSSRKIAERVLERTQTTITTETIEKNTHELNNVPGVGQISGVYQWVNKVYEAQMFNYGLRAIFDFMIPEPAAFLISAMTQAHDSTVDLVKPPPFDLTPSQITEYNFGYWVEVTGATDVNPPPELYRTKAADYKAGGGEHDADYNQSGQITIDDGYRAIFGSVGVVRNIWEADNSVDVVLGRRTQRMPGGDWLWTTTLDDERDSIPFGIDTFHCSQVAVAVEVKCQRTDRAFAKWQLETHAKLQTAHQAQVSDYEEKLANLKMQAGIAIHGANPAANRVTIQNELMKNCISILTDQHFDLFDAIETSPTNGLPQLDIFEAAGEGPYVRFFEQAFEWEHMSYITYPYFWGRKSQWDERIGYDDPDPAFVDFLRAGYCRVSVPARPGFEGAIDHFLTFGETWNGGPLPPISSPLYLPIADELAERLDRPGDEIPQGDPWTVRVPTSLVHLRDDDKLPKWKKNGAGEWIEA
jgi:hypothetical protein